jgi:Flp pilus assembly protein TadD
MSDKEEMEAIMATMASATAATIETAFARGYAKAREEYLMQQKKQKLDALYERVDATPPDKLVSLSETLYHEQCEARREYDDELVAVYSEVLQHVDDLIKFYRKIGK